MTPSPAYKVVWISTPPRTGSTWLFNVAREVLRRAGRTVLPERVPKEAPEMFELAQREAAADTDPGRVWVLKIHGTILGANLPGARIITSIRDPRDVLVSFRRFMDTSFEHALDTCEGVKRYPDGYRNHPAELLLRVAYPDIESRPGEVVRQVAAFLNVPLAPADETVIVGNLSSDEVRRKVDDRTQDLVERVRVNAPITIDEVIVRDQKIVRAYDVNTGFQTGHVSGNPSGAWRWLLSEDEKQMVHERFGDWFTSNGFEPM